MSENGNGQATGPQGNGAQSPDMQGQPSVQILAQYTRDLSFENPGGGTNIASRPQIELGVDLQAKVNSQDIYEVELKLRASATHENKPVFLVELAYCSLLQIQNMPPQVLEQVLLIEAPRMMFPFARRIISDAVRDGGMPPLMLEPIDFAALYQARNAQMNQAATESVAGSA